MNTVDPYALFEKTILSNGLTIHCLTQPKPFVAVEFIVHAGSREDDPQKEGVAHLVEHLVSRNILGYPDYFANRMFFSSTGGKATLGATNFLYTRYDFNIPTENLVRGFDMFGNMLMYGQLRNQVEEQRSVIVREFSQKFRNQLAIDTYLFSNQQFFPNHRTTHSTPLGNVQSIQNITREDCQQFYDRYYVPQNIEIVCVGGISMDDLVRLVEQSPFGHKKSGVRNTTLVSLENPHIPICKEKIVTMSEITTQKMEQSMVERTIALPPLFNEWAVQSIAQVLRQVLFEEVREKRSLAYQTSASLCNLIGVSDITVRIPTMPNAAKMVDGLITECVRLLLDKQSQFVHERDSAIKKINMRDHTAVEIADLAGDDISYFGHIRTAQDEIIGMNSVTWEEVEKTIQEMLREDRNVSLLIVP